METIGEISISDLRIGDLELIHDLAQQTSLRSLGRRRKLQVSYLSKALRRIERKLGAPLVVRSAKGIVFTPEGLRIAKVADHILNSARALSSESGVVRPKTRELLSIAAPRFIATSILSPIAEPLRASFDKYRFRVLDMSPDQISSAAFASACEIVVTVGTPSLSAAWDVRRSGKLGWGLFAATKHPLSSVAKEGEVLGFPFVVPNYWTGENFETGNDHCPVAWKDRLRGDETSAISSAMELVRFSSSQLVFAPRVVARRYIEAKELKEIRVSDWPAVTKNIYIGVRSDKVNRPFQKAFSALVAERLD